MPLHNTTNPNATSVTHVMFTSLSFTLHALCNYSFFPLIRAEILTTRICFVFSSTCYLQVLQLSIDGHPGECGGSLHRTASLHQQVLYMGVTKTAFCMLREDQDEVERCFGK